MKTPISGAYRVANCLRMIVLAGLFVGLINPLWAAAGGRKLLKMEISKDRSIAEVVVPKGYAMVSLQRFHRDGGWRKVALRKVKPGVAKFKLPSAGSEVRWRAIGIFEASTSRSKFPAAFYKGNNRFGAMPSETGNPRGFARTDANVMDPPAIAAGEDSAPVEADIWKTDGANVYFFNQLRGLQVLDVSNPVDPRLTASLRLPAMGEDLYLLPDSGAGKNLILLTGHYSDESGFTTRIRLVRFEAGKLTITHRVNVPGSLADSRMVGNRLILATNDWNDATISAGGSGAAAKCRITEWRITPGQFPQAAGAFELGGDYPVIAAGVDWLAVAVTPAGQWSYSEVTVFGLGSAGLTRLNAAPLRTAGLVQDKFKMQWRDNVLTTISEHNRGQWTWSPVTVLENFRVWGADVVSPAVVTDPLLGRLELASGESLFASRFAGNKAYVVTFLQTDPLWVVDLTDAQNPVIAGHIEVPGWSTHLEPIGDFLFSVGWESNSVAASLFDVSDASAPRLLRRINLGAPGSYSEATWDEQALKVLPAAGLAMVPLTSYDETTATSKASVQLIDLDLTAGELALRGSIVHDFDARRSDLIGSTVISISQRALVAAGIANRDAPSILSEVALAWPVDQVLPTGAHLVHIESGTEYMQGRATARVSPAWEPEAILAETDLGAGIVKAAELRDGKLFILRETGSSGAVYYFSPVFGQGTVRLHLDVYRADALPALTKIGSCTVAVKPDFTVAGRGLVWPQPDRPCVLLQPLSSFWFGWDYPMVRLAPSPGAPETLVSAAAGGSSPSRMMIDGPQSLRPGKAPQLLVFDVADPASPVADVPVALGTADTTPNEVIEAADGLVVVGATDWSNPFSGRQLAAGEAVHSAHVVEVGVSGSAIVRPGIDLPGELFAVTELDRNGFLAFSRRTGENDSTILMVSASDGHDAFEVASLWARSGVPATATGRRLFFAADGGVKRHRLTETGEWVAEAALDTGWTAQTLRISRGVLIGSIWNSMFAADSTASTVDKWNFPMWSFDPKTVRVAPDGDLLVPFGAYGAERLER